MGLSKGIGSEGDGVVEEDSVVSAKSILEVERFRKTRHSTVL